MPESAYATPGRKVPVVADADVLVVGGGFPGVCAAIAAARLGVSVALIERDGMLGGQAAEIYTFGLSSVVDNTGRQFIKGIPWEIICRTVAEGQTDPVWEMVNFARIERDGILSELERCGRAQKNDTCVNPNAFRFVLQSMVDEHGITTLLEAPLADVMLEGDRICGVIAMGDYSPFGVRAGVVIDTTPQSAVAALAGRPFEHPEVYTGTHPRVAGVDIHRLVEHVRRNPDDVSIAGYEEGELASLAKPIEQRVSLRFSGFAAARERAIADDPVFEMTGMGPNHTFTFLYERDTCGMYWVHSADWRYTRLDDPLHLSRTITEMRKRQWLTHKLFRGYVSGFEQAHLVDIHPHIARSLLRSREPGGFVEYDVPTEHITENGTLYDDAIARVRGHHDSGEAPNGWQLPYRSLIPKGLDGLLVTGKAACRSLHIHSTNAAVGQAAGVAAAVAVKAGVALRETPVSTVQEELKRQHAAVF